MLSPALETRNQTLFDKLVPASGPAKTLEGEFLRAVNKIVYRYFNDGDYWYCGYGTETAGPAAAFLMDIMPFGLGVLTGSYGTKGKDYEHCLEMLTDKVVGYIERRNDIYAPNTYDMLDFKSKYGVDGDEYWEVDEDEDWWDEDDDPMGSQA